MNVISERNKFDQYSKINSSPISQKNIYSDSFCFSIDDTNNIKIE